MSIGIGRTAWRCRVAALAIAIAVPFSAAAGSKHDTEALRARVAGDEVRRTLDALQDIPGAFPAVAAVIVHGDETPLTHVRGLARADRPGTVDRHSRFYIASQTKSFMALLAARLDETGVLPLDTTLAQVWPALALPAPADPARITMADLLSHQEGLRTDTLNFLTAYVRAVPAADYPAMLSRHAQARDAGFRYANIGDLVYGAALETRTGRTWQAWLQQEVLAPLQLDVHSATSDIPAARQVWQHRWDGEAWLASPPKPDALMHAAGGLVASADGMAAWMRANLHRRSPTGVPSARSFATAQRSLAKASLADGQIACDGYSLGWYTCVYKAHRVLMHPGSYTGVVSVTVLVPDADAGLSVVTTSDSAMEGVQLELMKAFIGLVTGEAGESERLRALVAGYPARLSKVVESRRRALREARADPAWDGWRWAPTPEQARALAGRFQSERLGRLDVVQGPHGLEARLGEMRLRLAPAAPRLFGATASPLDAPEPFRFSEDAQSLQWNDDTFVRIDD